MHQLDDTCKLRFNDGFDTQVRQARQEIDDVIAALKARADALAKAPRLVSTGDAGAARTDARAAVDAIAARVAAGDESRDQPATSGPQPSTLASALSP